MDLTKINDLLKRAESFNTGVVLAKSINDNEKILIKDNQNQLLKEGVFSDNEVTGTYAPMTIIYKKNLGQPYGHITFQDTGSFYDKMQIASLPDGAEFGSTDSKTGELEERYGNHIFGLTDDNLKKQCENIFKPALINGIKTSLGL